MDLSLDISQLQLEVLMKELFSKFDKGVTYSLTVTV
jgi:hypothetical protein